MCWWLPSQFWPFLWGMLSQKSLKSVQLGIPISAQEGGDTGLPMLPLQTLTHSHPSNC